MDCVYLVLQDRRIMIDVESIGYLLDMKGMVSMLTRWLVWRKAQKDMIKEVARKPRAHHHDTHGRYRCTHV